MHIWHIGHLAGRQGRMEEVWTPHGLCDGPLGQQSLWNPSACWPSAHPLLVSTCPTSSPSVVPGSQWHGFGWAQTPSPTTTRDREEFPTSAQWQGGDMPWEAQLSPFSSHSFKCDSRNGLFLDCSVTSSKHIGMECQGCCCLHGISSGPLCLGLTSARLELYTYVELWLPQVDTIHLKRGKPKKKTSVFFS